MMAVVVVDRRGRAAVARRPGASPRRMWLRSRSRPRSRDRVRRAGRVQVRAAAAAPGVPAHVRHRRPPRIVGDFAATGAHDYVLEHVPVISQRVACRAAGASRTGCLPGLRRDRLRGGRRVVGRRRRAAPASAGAARRPVELAARRAVRGLVALVLSFGDWIVSAVIACPSRSRCSATSSPDSPASAPCPGSSSRVQLALVSVRGRRYRRVCSRRSPRRAPSRSSRLLAAVVVAESAIGARLRARPDVGRRRGSRRRAPRPAARRRARAADQLRGTVVSWADAESPRQLLALRDHDPRVNGYSGFQPPGLRPAGRGARPLSRKPDALGLAQRLGVRYVVLRTQLVGRAVARDGGRRPSTGTAPVVTTRRPRPRIVAHLPPGAAQSVVKLPGGYLIDADAVEYRPRIGSAWHRKPRAAVIRLKAKGVLADGSRLRPDRPMIRRGTECRHVQRRFDPSAP